MVAIERMGEMLAEEYTDNSNPTVLCLRERNGWRYSISILSRERKREREEREERERGEREERERERLPLSHARILCQIFRLHY